MTIARWNNLAALGEASKASSDVPPELCPIRVTDFGSPPNLWMLALTHFKANIWSMKP